jgi:hypothetical protein
MERLPPSTALNPELPPVQERRISGFTVVIRIVTDPT